jgi:hypothetical protein
VIFYHLGRADKHGTGRSALYAQASYGEVLRCLLEGVRWLREDVSTVIAMPASIT